MSYASYKFRKSLGREQGISSQSFRQEKTIFRSPDPDGRKGTDIWLKIFKEWRTVATRYEKAVVSFLSIILIVATADFIKN
ncbi:hypothetical protein CFR75_17130 [Komagataeibacter xylinus]|uniref:Uncharacterized protein n=1 Tax=Komagataeibacter xylinus TaxID=28448 RepID=A0A318PDQ3_KOMXY|nr:hypothetical protein CXP35_05380 [Komagataeibacter xylinus]PYD55351.1 hypothetical protein CFR75_17130 [Komagataeibacter xylinus]